MTAQDPAHPEYGDIQLVFTENPVQLRQWIVTDGSGERTTVVLGEMTTGAQMSAQLFSIVNEARQVALGRRVPLDGA